MAVCKLTMIGDNWDVISGDGVRRTEWRAATDLITVSLSLRLMPLRR